MNSQPLLTYCATPSRLINLTQETYDFVKSQGHAPLHPFKAFPQEKDFGDKGRFGRELALKFAFKMVGISDQLFLFGISDGTIQEAYKAVEFYIPVKVYIQQFDPEWRKYYSDLKVKYPSLGKFLSKHNVAI